MSIKNKILIVFAFLSTIISNDKTLACTRIVYQGPNGTILTARSMDWRGEIPANLWVFPRGIDRFGEAEIIRLNGNLSTEAL